VEKVDIGQHKTGTAIIRVSFKQMLEHRLAAFDVAPLPARSRGFELSIVPVAIEVFCHLLGAILAHRADILPLIASDILARFAEACAAGDAR
jgi:hypothetical protein